jgi:hypothetical protein
LALLGVLALCAVLALLRIVRRRRLVDPLPIEPHEPRTAQIYNVPAIPKRLLRDDTIAKLLDERVDEALTRAQEFTDEPTVYEGQAFAGPAERALIDQARQVAARKLLPRPLSRARTPRASQQVFRTPTDRSFDENAPTTLHDVWTPDITPEAT